MFYEETKSASVATAMRLFLWPGDRFCNWLNVRDQDSRMLLRMFVNLTVDSKVALSIVFICTALA